MGFWSSLLRYGGRAVKSGGDAVIHPAKTLRTTGQAVKTAAVGGGVGYVAWEKLTSDKSVARIVSDAVIGESATNSVVETADDVKELKNKAGEAVDAVNGAMSNMDSKWSGMSNFFRGLFSGNALDMFGNFFSNLGKGNVSGMSIAGLIAAAYLVFGRFGWLGKIAGTMLGLMLIGNNSNISQVLGTNGNSGNGRKPENQEEQTETKGLRR